MSSFNETSGKKKNIEVETKTVNSLYRINYSRFRDSIPMQRKRREDLAPRPKQSHGRDMADHRGDIRWTDNREGVTSSNRYTYTHKHMHMDTYSCASTDT